jgi:hypothetical protein
MIACHEGDRAQNRPCFRVGTRLPDHWSPAPLGADWREVGADGAVPELARRVPGETRN